MPQAHNLTSGHNLLIKNGEIALGRVLAAKCRQKSSISEERPLIDRYNGVIFQKKAPNDPLVGSIDVIKCRHFVVIPMLVRVSDGGVLLPIPGCIGRRVDLQPLISQPRITASK
jgi:hypothetical protein